MVDWYISDTALQLSSQLLVSGTYLWMLYTYIAERKRLFACMGILYAVISFALIYDVQESIIFSVIACILFLCMNQFRKRLPIIVVTTGYLLINHNALFIRTNQETLFYMMLKLIALECLFFVYECIITLKRKEYPNSALLFHTVFFGVSFGTNLLLLLHHQNMRRGTKDVLYFSVFANSALYIFVSVFFGIYMKNRWTMQKLEIKKLKDEMVYRQYEILKQKYEHVSILKHDMKHHLQTISILLYQGKREEVQEYIDQFASNMNENAMVYHCSNAILEIVINEKYLEATNQGIGMELRCEDAGLEYIDDVDVIAIFANVLDNAIEAASMLEGERKICVTLLERQDGVLFQVMNQYRGKVLNVGGKLRTTKRGHEGWGIASIRKTVERYGGTMQISYDDMIFTITVRFKQ